ncbi:MAG: SRPBCC family protein [Flavobacteriaceae bacterium]|nr:SRPBCC family protein [Mangrovimonas sp.]MCB0437154.1 SRPBCC family protein [Mangrovimonas sp.]
MINFKKHSGIYTLKAKQELNLPIKEAWDFFSRPENLEKITPPFMGFKITSEVESKAYSGQIITYKVNILPGISSKWVTEITQVQEGQFFIDEQRFGPYRMWHHEHFFYELPNDKTLMEDKISYKIPFGILGHLAQKLFIKKQLKTIFEFRKQTLNQMFNG